MIIFRDSRIYEWPRPADGILVSYWMCQTDLYDVFTIKQVVSSQFGATLHTTITG
jgi:hypothetical protein